MEGRKELWMTSDENEKEWEDKKRENGWTLLA